MNRTSLDLALRYAVAADIPALVGLSVACAQPWRAEEFAVCVKSRRIETVLAEVREGVVGLVVYELRPGTLRVVNLAVNPPARRHGVGTRLAEHVAWKLASLGRERAVVSVHERNLTAQLFLKAQGWKAAAVLPGQTPSGDQLYLFELRTKVPA